MKPLERAAINASKALKAFADCCDQIDEAEDGEEWAKFRLLVKDYRLARKAMIAIDAALEEG